MNWIRLIVLQQRVLIVGLVTMMMIMFLLAVVLITSKALLRHNFLVIISIESSLGVLNRRMLHLFIAAYHSALRRRTWIAFRKVTSRRKMLGDSDVLMDHGWKCNLVANNDEAIKIWMVWWLNHSMSLFNNSSRMLMTLEMMLVINAIRATITDNQNWRLVFIIFRFIFKRVDDWRKHVVIMEIIITESLSWLITTCDVIVRVQSQMSTTQWRRYLWGSLRSRRRLAIVLIVKMSIVNLLKPICTTMLHHYTFVKVINLAMYRVRVMRIMLLSKPVWRFWLRYCSKAEIWLRITLEVLLFHPLNHWRVGRKGRKR